MAHDAQGNRASFASAEAARAFDHMVEGFLKYRLDTPQRLKAALQLDPEAPLPHIDAGRLRHAGLQGRACAGRPRRARPARKLGGNPREQMHLAALDAWADGAQDRAIAIWERIIAEHPRDIMAFRFHHFGAFWMGRAPAMWNAVEVHPARIVDGEVPAMARSSPAAPSPMRRRAPAHRRACGA